MPKQVPALQDRRDFPAWQKAIQNKLTPSQWATVTWSDGGPPDSGPDCLLWEKVRAQAYNTIIQSIPNFIIAGLGAHDELNTLRELYHADDEYYRVCRATGGCPRELYDVICKYFDPTRAMIAAQVKCIANTNPAKFKDVDEYLARMWLSKLCIDPCLEEDNPVLTILLCDAIKDSHPAVVAELASVDYKRTFAEMLRAVAPERKILSDIESRPAERKRVAENTPREAKRAKTEAEEEASGVTVASETVDASG
ncbi:hypothetical protein CcaCcLH18_05679 [Colletotrichum camelliae]|nr:hypothetical protein CcaCcLH18_05679 [Colletotrichum camelliae]